VRDISMTKKEIVSPGLYSEEYFLIDNEGYEEYAKGLDTNIHPKFIKALNIANPQKGNTVLDLGCGRAELVYYAVKKGAKALGIDYSEGAIKVAQNTIDKLPPEIKHLAKVEVADIVTYNFQEKYDIIFMLEIAEHMHDWQLEEAFKKIKTILKKSGKLVIITPNYYYENYLCPLKRIINIPGNLFKIPLRILRGKYKPKGLKEVLRKIFRVKLDRGQLNRDMHVNVTTRSKLKKLLKDFNAKIRCEDHSKNPISLLTQKWWGRDIIVVAKSLAD